MYPTMLLKSSSQSASTSDSMELLDDIKEDLISPSLSLVSSKHSLSVQGSMRPRSISLHSLPRPVSCPVADKSASPWSRSRDSGMPLSGSSPSVCSGLLAVVEGLRAELRERDETIRVLRENYVALLMARAHLENALDQMRLCTTCASLRKLEGSSRAARTASQSQPQYTVADNLSSRLSESYSPESSPSRESPSSDAVGQSSLELQWLHASRESNVCSDATASHPVLSSRHMSIPEENLLENVGSSTRTSAVMDGKTGPQHDSTRNVALKEEATQELLLCCLDAVHVATRAVLQRSNNIRSSLLALSQRPQ